MPATGLPDGPAMVDPEYDLVPAGYVLEHPRGSTYKENQT